MLTQNIKNTATIITDFEGHSGEYDQSSESEENESDEKN